MFQSNLSKMADRRFRIGFFLMGLSLIFAAACSTDNQPTNNARTVNAAQSTPAPTATPDPAAVAAELYAQNCSICHRDTGKGGKLILDGKSLNPEDLTTEKMKKMTDEKLISYVTNGIEDEGMPAFKDKLSADEIKQVVAHVRALQTR